MKVIGVMSGSSLDGLDIALLDLVIPADKPGTRATITEPSLRQPDSRIVWNLIAATKVDLPEELKQSLKKTIHQVPSELIKTEQAFSIFVSEALMVFKDQYQVTNPSAVGIHGHTIIHSPEHCRSWQLLNGALVAERINETVISDFRMQDICMGGQGTPMAVIADRDLFPGYKYYLNLGGIANVSIRNNDEWTAYDICPCNQLLDHIAQQVGQDYDMGGKLAASGKPIKALLEKLNSNPFLQKAPPKSLDNGYSRTIIAENSALFNEHSTPDILRTLVDYIVHNIAAQVAVGDESVSMFVTGGGTFNSFLIEQLNEKLKKQFVSLHVPEENIIHYKEAILIAYAAQLSILNKPNFIPTATGASAAASGGSIFFPSSHTHG